jgi:hypothetical protein
MIKGAKGIEVKVVFKDYNFYSQHMVFWYSISLAYTFQKKEPLPKDFLG